MAKTTKSVRREPLISKIDCIQIPVPDLESGLRFYKDSLGHNLVWRTDTSAGLRLPDSDSKLVIQTERKELEANLLVESVDKAVVRIEEAGGKTLLEPFDIQIGRCAVVQDPWANRLLILDMTKGPLHTDKKGNVVPLSRGEGT